MVINTFIDSSIEDEVELNELEKLFYNPRSSYEGDFLHATQIEFGKAWRAILDDIEKDLFCEKEK